MFGLPTRDKPIQHGEINNAWVVGWVEAFVDRSTWSIKNVTLKNNDLHPDEVTRRIVREGHNLFIETHGTGFGAGGQLNDYFSHTVWESVDWGLIKKAGVYPMTRPD